MRALAVLLVCLVVLLVAVGTDRAQPDFVADLQSADGVARVELLVFVANPACRIVHIADYHFVSRDDLAADLRDQDPNVTDADIEAEYDRIIATVRTVQPNQLRLIRWLAHHHSVRMVHLEGLTDQDAVAYGAMIRSVKKGSMDAIAVGAPGQALIAGDIEGVATAEDEIAYQAADPLAEGGVRFEGLENDAREDAMARRLSASGPLAVVVLGAAHDLSQHIKALGDCDYVKVYVEGCPAE